MSEPVEQRDLGGNVRAVVLVMGDWCGDVRCELLAGGTIVNITKLELTLDAKDLLLRGWITRLSRDRVFIDGNSGDYHIVPDVNEPYRLVREPILVMHVKHQNRSTSTRIVDPSPPPRTRGIET